MSATDRLAKEILALKKRVDGLHKPQLALSSVKLSDGSERTVAEVADTAEEAKVSADVAIESANGKNTVYYSVNVPGSTPNTAGDVWFHRDFSTGDIKGLFFGAGGTDWIAQELRHEVISSLDAGKITVGELVGERLAADAIDGKTIRGAELIGPRIVTAEDGEGPRVRIETEVPVGGSGTPGIIAFEDDHDHAVTYEQPGYLRGYVNEYSVSYDRQVLTMASGYTNDGTLAFIDLQSARSDGTGTLANEGTNEVTLWANGGRVRIYGGVDAADMRPVTTGNTSAAGSTSSSSQTPIGVGIAFTAPPSGAVTIDTWVEGRCNPANTAFEGLLVVKTGSTVGSGSVVTNPVVAVNRNNFYVTLSKATFVDGLTPGESYNAYINYRAPSGGTAYVSQGSVTVTPSL